MARAETPMQSTAASASPRMPSSRRRSPSPRWSTLSGMPVPGRISPRMMSTATPVEPIITNASRRSVAAELEHAGGHHRHPGHDGQEEQRVPPGPRRDSGQRRPAARAAALVVVITISRVFDVNPPAIGPKPLAYSPYTGLTPARTLAAIPSGTLLIAPGRPATASSLIVRRSGFTSASKRPRVARGFPLTADRPSAIPFVEVEDPSHEARLAEQADDRPGEHEVGDACRSARGSRRCRRSPTRSSSRG